VYICLYNRLLLVVFVFARLEVVVVVGRSVATRSTPSRIRIEKIRNCPSPLLHQRRNPVKKEPLEPIYEPVFIPILPSSMGMQKQK